MKHLDEGILLAFRDEAPVDDEVRTHLASCEACGSALDQARARADAVGAALATLDGAPIDSHSLEETRRRVRDRVSGSAATRRGVHSIASRRRSTMAAWSLSRAAGILLLAAAGLSALPGSPVRTWLSDAIQGDDAGIRPAGVETAPAAMKAPEAAGVRLSVPSGALRVVLQGVAEGSEVRVRLVAGTEAAVFAPAGSRFTSASGRVEALVTPGEVRIELPWGVDPVSLVVEGRTWLTSGDGGLTVSGPTVSRTADEIVFMVPRS